MSVRIPISADAKQVTAAFDQIKDAIRRAGQEGREFAKIDLSHPELKDFAADLVKIRQQAEDLTKVSRGTTAAAARRLTATGSSILDTAAVSRLFADPADRDRFLSRAGRYVLHGTRFALPPPPAPAPAPAPPAPPAPPGGGGGGGLLGGVGGSVMGAAKAATGFFLAQAGIGAIADMAARAVGQAQEEAVATDHLMRTMRDGATDYYALRDAVRETTKGLRISYGEMQRVAMTWARVSGRDSVEDVMFGSKVAVGMARSYGMDEGATTQTLARARFLGESPARFAMLIGEAVGKEGMPGQAQEVMQSLLRWSESASRLIVTGTNVRDYAAMYAGMNATGLPGLRGANAEALIGQVDAAVRQGGAAGEASMAMTYRALSRRGITDPYQIQYMLAGGMFEHVGKNGKTMFDVMRDEVNGAYAGLPYYQRVHAMSRMFGVNMRQGAALMNFKPGDLGRGKDMLKGYGLSLQSLDPTALADVAEVLGSNNLDEERRKILRRGDLDKGERDAISGASGEDLRRILVKTLAERGQEKTVGTQVEDAATKFSNALTQAGTGLVPIIADLKSATGSLVQEIGHLSTVLGDWYAKTTGKTGDMSDPDSDFDENGMPKGGVDEYGRPLGANGQPAHIPSPPLSTPQLDRKEAMLRDRFASDLGISPAAAAGLVSNLTSESGLRPDVNEANPAIPGSRGGFGYAQWTGPRRLAMEAWAKDQGLDPRTDEANIKWLEHELSTQYPGVLAALKRGDITPTEAANTVFGGYISGGAAQLEHLRGGHIASAGHISGLPSTPLPKSDPAMLPASAPIKFNFSHQIEPLRITVNDPTGGALFDDFLPITTVHPPAASGLAAGGGGP